MPFGQVFVYQLESKAVSEVETVRGKKIKLLRGEGTGLGGMTVICSNGPSEFIGRNCLTSDSISSTAESDQMTVIIKESEKSNAYIWQTGDSETVSRVSIAGSNIASVSVGSRHMLFRNESGCVYAYGRNVEGQCGTQASAKSAKSPGCQQLLKPRNVPLRHSISRISCGSHFSTALTIDGQLFAWGENLSFQIGLQGCTSVPIPTLIPISGRVIDVSCGWSHVGVVNEQGEVYMWGLNLYGQLGNGCEEASERPCKVDLPMMQRIVCHGHQTAVLTMTGNQVYSWGKSSSNHYNSPIELSVIKDMDVVISDIALSQTSLMYFVPSAVYQHEIQTLADSSRILSMRVGGFWPSDSIVVRYISPSVEDAPRSALATYSAEYVTCVIPPLQMRSEAFKVDIAIDGKHFFHTNLALNLFE